MTDAPTRDPEAAPRPWHALAAEEVQEVFGAGSGGLSVEEAHQRLEADGPNALDEIPPPSRLSTLISQFRSPLIYILLVATVVTLLLEEWIDAGVIAAILLINASIGYWQERRAEAAVRALLTLVSPHAKVIRGGREWDVESRELVRGDLVLLESGDRVPADLRLVTATSLEVDESLLTGESTSVTKGVEPVEEGAVVADRRCMAYSGSIVARGRARGVVVATGTDTELGRISEQVRSAKSFRSPLQERMARFGNLIGIAILVAAILVFAMGLAIGESGSDMFLTAVALAVAAIPEGLPVVLTIALALGVRRMSRRNAIIRHLPAVETLGSTSLIGSDKTGTLTENRMTVQEIWSAGERFSLEEAGVPPDPREAATVETPAPDAEARTLVLLAGVLANEGHLLMAEDGVEGQGDPTEVALLVAAARLGIDPETADELYEEVAEIPFESERRFAASIRRREGEEIVFVKGAPERVLEMCDEVSGESAGPDEVLEAAQSMASRGLRVLAMAARRIPHGSADEHREEPRGLTFLGLQGMMDPPREGVRDAIAGCRSSGIRVVMITGDHALTARAIAADLGLVDSLEDPVVTGAEIEELSDEELEERLEEVSVFARVSPEHKLRVVEAAQRRGDVVAVTGDGVNDAPALKRADIGIAMGSSGTDVAREAADMVLADDNFVSIYAAVEEGRVTFDNVRKVSFFLLSAGASALVFIPASMLLGWPLPLLPAQLLWLNLVSRGLQDLALAFEPGEPDVLERPPRRRREPVISALLWERTALVAVVMAIGALYLFDWQLGRSGNLEEARTVALSCLVVFGALHVGNVRSEHRSAFAISPFSNPFLFYGQVGALAFQVAAMYLPPTQFVLRITPIDAQAWIRIVFVSLSIVVAVEIHKLLRRPRPSS